MLLESAELLRLGNRPAIERVIAALSISTRETDIKGWFQEGVAIGVIFTELGADVNETSVVGALRTKVTEALAGRLTINECSEVRLSFQVFPTEWAGPGGQDDSSLRERLFPKNGSGGLTRILKRAIDVAGSLAALTLGLPVFLLIAVAVKLTSAGPVLFRQERLGEHGKRFQFLKFRSMYVNNNPQIHQQYVQRFISNGNGCNQADRTNELYKLTADPRITAVGRFLRKTSLDEIPQFLNVLRGEMSLVGPRPPLPYEAECYRVWHWARLLDAKPGITGLWQVAGRSRVPFDEMVRMDLRYARSWSLWLDLKILLQTPFAVLSGDGAQ